jgi:hypothetical protein
MKLALIEKTDGGRREFRLIPDEIGNDEMGNYLKKSGYGSEAKCLCITGLGTTFAFPMTIDWEENFQVLCQAAGTLEVQVERSKLEAFEATSNLSFLPERGHGTR